MNEKQTKPAPLNRAVKAAPAPAPVAAPKSTATDGLVQVRANVTISEMVNGNRVFIERGETGHISADRVKALGDSVSVL